MSVGWQILMSCVATEPPPNSSESTNFELLICKVIVPGVGGAGVGKLGEEVDVGLAVEGSAGDTEALSAVAEEVATASFGMVCLPFSAVSARELGSTELPRCHSAEHEAAAAAVGVDAVVAAAAVVVAR